MPLTPRHSPSVRPTANRSRSAFTLIELLTVIAIIGILAAVLVPVVSQVRTTARKAQCTSNLRQIGTAFQLYANENRGLFPASRKQPANTTLTSRHNPTGGPWQEEISPYITRKQSIGQIKSQSASNNIGHCPAYDLLFSGKTVSSTPYNAAGYGMSNWIKLTSKPVGTWDTNLRFPLTDVTSPPRTILVGDSSDYHLGIGLNTGWGTVADDPDRPDGYTSGAPRRHGESANYLFADGHVSSLSPDAARTSLLQL